MGSVKYYVSLPEVPAYLGVDYDRVYYAVLKGVVKPKQYGKSRLLSHDQIEILRQYFAERDKKKAS
jgi:hypothetical protein